MRIYKKAILPRGFKAFGLSCGIKKSGKPDLALFYSCYPAKAAGLFTTNKIQAAPVLLCRKFLSKKGCFRAIIANSGNANCFTGKKGIEDSLNTAVALADSLGIKKEGVLVSSTGIIARRLPVLRIKSAIPGLIKGLSESKIKEAARAIMTTDTFPKVISARVNLGGRVVTICAVAKGAGMISPNMATLLAFIFTDADLPKSLLEKALREAVAKSFNCITVDGCMSTNDSVIILANGAVKSAAGLKAKEFALFCKALNRVSLELAKLLVRDAEGASKFIEINVSGAKNFTQAKAAALAIANSNLFKTAIYGMNPNFGRIAAAVGSSGADLCQDSLKVRVSPLKKKDIQVRVSLGRGRAQAKIYTCDLTPEYIKVNAEYN